MYRILLTVFLSLSVLAPVWASDKDFSECEWVPGRLVVDFIEDVGTLYNQETADGSPVKIGVPSVDDLLARYSITVMYRISNDKVLAKLDFPPDFYRYMVLQGPEDIDVLQMMRDFDANRFVAAADPDLLHPVMDTEPNDALWGSQWDKRCMNVPRAWDFSTGSEAIQVIAIDGGTCWQHPDFRENLWVNPGEDLDGDGDPWTWDDYPGDTDDLDGVDNEGNGYEDDFIAWDFIRNISGCVPQDDCDNMEDNDPISWGDHGTHTLGLMGAQGNNEIGCTGVCWDVSIMASRAGYTRASDNQGLIVSSAAVSCIMWALGHGVDVINMSYGSSSSGGPEGSAVATAWDNGAILCAASGNDFVTTPHYPAAFEDVIAVGSTDNQSNCNGISNFSNHGTWVDCFAPGGGVMSTLCPNQNPSWGNNQGTSMASPNAAGVCALLWSIFPNYSNQQIKDLLLNGCVDMSADNPSIDPTYLGWGRVDAANSIAMVLPYLTIDESWIENDDDGDGRLEGGETTNFYIEVSNEQGWSTGQNVQVSISTDEGHLSISGGDFSLGNIAAGETVSNSGSPVLITAQLGFRPTWAPINILFTGGNGLRLERTIMLRIGRPDVLIVDDDNGQFFSDFYGAALLDEPAAEYLHDVWDRATDDNYISYDDFDEYTDIIWVCGNETSNTLTADDMNALASFMDNGGNVLVVGQGIDNDATVTGSDFYANYLHASVAGGDGSSQVDGVAGDLISDGQNLILIGGGCGGNGSVSPSEINPMNGGVGFYTYTSSGGFGAVRYAGAYKSAYFAFALEAACGLVSSTHHTVVIRSIMDWFGATTVDADRPEVAMPGGFALNANFPNPFNPDTKISFDVPYRTRVSIKVFDLLGRQVDKLVDHTMSAGNHKVAFHANNLASGIYLVHMKADNFSATRRIVLMK